MVEKELSMRLLMPYMLYLKTIRKSLAVADTLSQKKNSLILRNADSSGLRTSHLKFVWIFYRVNFWDRTGTIQQQQQCSMPSIALEQKLFMRVGFELKEFPGPVCFCILSWICEQEYQLWQGFSGLEYVSNGNWAGDHTN